MRQLSDKLRSSSAKANAIREVNEDYDGDDLGQSGFDYMRQFRRYSDSDLPKPSSNISRNHYGNAPEIKEPVSEGTSQSNSNEKQILTLMLTPGVSLRDIVYSQHRKISAFLYGEEGKTRATNLQLGYHKKKKEHKPKKEPVSPETLEQMTYSWMGKTRVGRYIHNKLLKREYLSGSPRFIKKPGELESPIENILIHGTFNGAAAENGWTRPKGEYANIVREKLGGAVIALQWSGKNHKRARREAGRELANRIVENKRKGIITNVIAHSHGGSVAFEAIKRFKAAEGYIEQLVTLGTPIRRDHAPSSEDIQQKVGRYLHVSGGKDLTAIIGGFDFVNFAKRARHERWAPFFRGVSEIPGAGNLANIIRAGDAENKRGKPAKRTSELAHAQLRITDAGHSDLHSAAVLELLRPLEPLPVTRL